MAVRLLLCVVLTVCLAPPVPASGQADPTAQSAAGPTIHPEPREGVDAREVIAVSALPRTATAIERRAYGVAAEMPQLLDGIYSFCERGRSLLTCFETLQALASEQAVSVTLIVQTMARNGYDLPRIRQHLDSVAAPTGGRQ